MELVNIDKQFTPGVTIKHTKLNFTYNWEEISLHCTIHTYLYCFTCDFLIYRKNIFFLKCFSCDNPNFFGLTTVGCGLKYPPECTLDWTLVSLKQSFKPQRRVQLKVTERA